MITAGTGMPIHLCGPRRPWRRGTNENTDRLQLQCPPKNADLRGFGQEDLDAIATELNGRAADRADGRQCPSNSR